MQGLNLKTVFKVTGIAWLLIVAWVILLPAREENWEAAITLLFILTPITFALFWFMGSFVRIGMEGEEPYWAVIARFGRPIEAVLPGMYFRPLWIVERVVLFPTGQKTMWFTTTEAWTMELGDRQAQPLALDIAVYMRWPKPGVNYDFDGGTKVINGSDLLKDAYYYLPRALRNPDRSDYIDVLGRFLENAVIGGVKVVVGRRDHLDARQKNQEMEEEIKDYLLSELGNPFHDLGIAPECLDIELTKVIFPEETGKALREKELARRSGEALVETSKHRKEASENDAETTRALLTVHLDKGVSPEVAAMIVSRSTGGEAMTVEKLRDLAIALKLGF